MSSIIEVGGESPAADFTSSFRDACRACKPFTSTYLRSEDRHELPAGMSSLAMRNVRRRLLLKSVHVAPQRFFATSKDAKDAMKQQINVDELLSKPSWSVASLLPKQNTSDPLEVSSKQLRHLLKLSALPPPKDDAEEATMLRTLSSQLHFVKEIQKSDTTGVEPLQSLRDETAEGEQNAELGLEALKEALAAEDVRGKFHPRIRRRRDRVEVKKDEWNVLGTAGKKTGRYFVVEGGK
jgi:Asp-tRNA(Asn)/Glu-tRNA(Gln) amidotransferase C subunit